MKARSPLMSTLALISLVAGLTFVIAAWQTRQAKAITNTEERRSEFGFVDLGAGQTARLNVMNLRRTPPPEPDTPPPDPDAQLVRLSFDIYVSPPPDPEAPSCVTRYRFLRRESCDVVLMPGEAASFDFTATDNAKVAASISSLGGPDTREGSSQLTPEPHLAPMLEVREAARTVFVVPGVVKGFNPQPDPPGGVVK